MMLYCPSCMKTYAFAGDATKGRKPRCFTCKVETIDLDCKSSKDQEAHKPTTNTCLVPYDEKFPSEQDLE